MKNLFALVFFFPLAVFAQGKENLPSQEQMRLYRNCCTQQTARVEPSILGEMKHEHWTKHLVKKRRIQLYAANPDKPEAGRLSFERHQKAYGFWYRQETGILDGSR